jgi:hypothetical protein
MGFSLAKASKAIIHIGMGNPLGLAMTGIECIQGIYEAYKTNVDDEFNTYITNPFLTSAEQDILINKLRDQNFFDKFAYDAQAPGWYLLNPEKDGKPPKGEDGEVSKVSTGNGVGMGQTLKAVLSAATNAVLGGDSLVPTSVTDTAQNLLSQPLLQDGEYSVNVGDVADYVGGAVMDQIPDEFDFGAKASDGKAPTKADGIPDASKPGSKTVAAKPTDSKLRATKPADGKYVAPQYSAPPSDSTKSPLHPGTSSQTPTNSSGAAATPTVAPSSGLAKVGSRAAQMKLEMAQKGQISPTFEADSQARDAAIATNKAVTQLQQQVETILCVNL